MKTKIRVCLIGMALGLSMVSGMTGCAGLEDKAVAIASGVDAAKIETTGSVSSGTFLPNIIFGRAVNSICTAPAFAKSVTAQPTYSKSRSNSFFGSLFGINDTTETIAYTGVPGESAAETEKRCKALAGLSTVSAKSSNNQTASSQSADSVKTDTQSSTQATSK